MRDRSLICTLAIGAIFLSVSARAQPSAPAPSWQNLTPKERYDAMKNYWQHEQRPQEQKHDIDQQYERWRSMPPDQQDRIRQNYQRLQQLPPPERNRFEQKYEKWKQQATPHP
jgi:uncharacterized protein DUF3106